MCEQEAGVATAEVCRTHSISSSATFFAWKAKYGGLDVSQARKLRALEEKARLKKLLTETMFDVAVLRDVTAKKVVMPVARREAVAHARAAFDLSERRACAILGFDRTSVRYRSSRDEDIDLRGRLRELVAQRRRFSWHRLMILLARKGIVPNQK